MTILDLGNQGPLISLVLVKLGVLGLFAPLANAANQIGGAFLDLTHGGRHGLEKRFISLGCTRFLPLAGGSGGVAMRSRDSGGDGDDTGERLVAETVG
ncbi:MAG: hypothetical protein JOS17DRAFT_737093 [Linnemannia elongata]|nr:MAG: hypothetical protein JOS17DRAFT_737093 [Linnemannia elongata]